jgi:hypothetical protein
MLTLPVSNLVERPDEQTVLDTWSAYLGGYRNLLLVKSTDRARKLLMAAFGIEGNEPVGIPANTRRPLSEAVKRSHGTPLFVELDCDLEFVSATPGLDETRLVWAQPVGGMPAPRPVAGKTLFVDYAFSLPAPDVDDLAGAATLWGLHLDSDMKQDGALIAFSSIDLYARACQLFDTSEDLPDLNAAMNQCRRLGGPAGIAARQLAHYRAATNGLDHAGALPQADMLASPALPFGLAIRIPEEADIATFISSVRNEHLSLDWFPEIQPMFYVVNQVTRDQSLTQQTADHLARWVFSPIGPDFVDDEITHCVLGPVKAAEYTGVRWYTNVERARWYHDLMLEWYGPNHDAYRCAFEHRLPVPTGL